MNTPTLDDLISRLRERARIRRQIPTRKSVQNGEPDRISDLLEEADNNLERLRELKHVREGLREALGAIEFALGAIGKYPDRQHPMTASEVLFRNVLSSYRQYLKKVDKSQKNR